MLNLKPPPGGIVLAIVPTLFGFTTAELENPDVCWQTYGSAMREPFLTPDISDVIICNLVFAPQHIERITKIAAEHGINRILTHSDPDEIREWAKRLNGEHMENTNQHSILVFGADMSKLDDELRRNPQFRYLGASDIPRFREISPNAKRVIYNHSGLGNRPTRDLQMRIQEAREAGLTLIGIEVAHQGLLDSALRRELLSNGSPPAANANPVPNPALHSSNGVQGNHDSPTVAITGRNKVQIIFDGMKEGRDGDALFAMLKAEYPSAERKELGQLKWQVRHGRVRGRGMFSLSEPSIESKEPVRALGPEESIPKAGSVAEMLTKFRDGLASSLGILDEIIAKSRRQEETIEAIRPLGAMIKGVAEKLGDI